MERINGTYWHKWLNKIKLSALEACLNFAISFKEIDKIILGIDSQNHLLEIIKNFLTTIT